MVQRIRSGSPYESMVGFSRAVRVGNRVLVSGTAPIPAPGDGVAEDPGDQLRRCGQIIEAALEEAGARLSWVVRTRMFITDPGDVEAIGRAHAEVFAEAQPASTMVVASLLDPAWKVEIEAEAIIPG